MTFSGCARQSAGVSLIVPPSDPVLTYPNSADGQWLTTLRSSASTTQAGVDGRVLQIDAVNGAEHSATELTLDIDGNLGIRGTLFSRSSRSEKRDIEPFRGDAVKAIGRVAMVTYHYRNELPTDPVHVGFIAEDAPAAFVGPHHDSFNINNTVALSLAATQQLNRRIEALSRDVDELKRQLAERRASR